MGMSEFLSKINSLGSTEHFYACGVSVRCEGREKLSFLIPAKKAQDVRREEAIGGSVAPTEFSLTDLIQSVLLADILE